MYFMKDRIMVSICCLVYNHEKYLRRCLDGFIMQKTNFKYEVLIHDDASTDASAKIIKEYEKKYPDIIKPIYQVENQYSKGVQITTKYQYPRVKGKYIAFCEGDDYWTDPNKLQTQYSLMEKNENISICVHNVVKMSEDGTILASKFPAISYAEGVINKRCFLEDELVKSKWVFQTSSFFIRKKYIDELLTEKPKFIELSTVGDLPLQLFMITRGDIYYIDKDMSNYRMDSVSSVTARNARNIEKRKLYLNGQIESMKEYNKYTGGEYEELIHKYIISMEVGLLMADNNYQQLITQKKYRKIMSTKTKILCTIMYFFPHIGAVLYRFYKQCFKN